MIETLKELPALADNLRKLIEMLKGGALSTMSENDLRHVLQRMIDVFMLMESDIALLADGIESQDRRIN